MFKGFSYFTTLVLLILGCNTEQSFEPFLLSMNDSKATQIEFSKTAKLLEMYQGQDKKELNLGLEMMNLDSAIYDLFDPEKNPCADLSSRVKNKLKERKSENQGKGWVPKKLKPQMDRLPKTVGYLKGKSVSYLLHTVNIIRSKGDTFTITLLGSPIYNNLDLDFFMDKQSDSYLYSLDCSGYFNAALEAAGGVKDKEISAKASTAISNSGSMMLAYGTMYSPILAALKPTSYPNKMPDSIRILLLTSLLEALPSNIPDSSIVDLSITYQVLWSSKTGKSSFNGEASFKANVSGALPVASLNLNAEGGGKMNRSSEFTNFDTYLLSVKKASEVEPIRVEQVKKVLQTLKEKNKNNKVLS